MCTYLIRDSQIFTESDIQRSGTSKYQNFRNLPIRFYESEYLQISKSPGIFRDFPLHHGKENSSDFLWVLLNAPKRPHVFSDPAFTVRITNQWKKKGPEKVPPKKNTVGGHHYLTNLNKALLVRKIPRNLQNLCIKLNPSKMGPMYFMMLAQCHGI